MCWNFEKYCLNTEHHKHNLFHLYYVRGRNEKVDVLKYFAWRHPRNYYFITIFITHFEEFDISSGPRYTSLKGK